jgi:hypothetical protein
LPACLLIFLACLFVIVVVVLAINDKHALLVNMPTLFGSLNALFQWTKLSKSETLVFTGTRKLEN